MKLSPHTHFFQMKAGEERKSEEFPLFDSAAICKILMFLTTLETGVCFFGTQWESSHSEERSCSTSSSKKGSVVSPAKARTKAYGRPTCQKDMLASVHHILQIMPLTAPSSRWLLVRLFSFVFLASFQDRRRQSPGIDFSVQQ